MLPPFRLMYLCCRSLFPWLDSNQRTVGSSTELHGMLLTSTMVAVFALRLDWQFCDVPGLAQVAGFEPTIDGFGVRPHTPICCTHFESSGTSKVSIPKRHASHANPLTAIRLNRGTVAKGSTFRQLSDVPRSCGYRLARSCTQLFELPAPSPAVCIQRFDVCETVYRRVQVVKGSA